MILFKEIKQRIYYSIRLVAFLLLKKTMIFFVLLITLCLEIYPVEACFPKPPYTKEECVGNICEGGCCPVGNYTCCANNLFCARNVTFCVDYSRYDPKTIYTVHYLQPSNASSTPSNLTYLKLVHLLVTNILFVYFA